MMQHAAITLLVLLLWTAIVTAIITIVRRKGRNPLVWGLFGVLSSGLTLIDVLIVPHVKQKAGTEYTSTRH